MKMHVLLQIVSGSALLIAISASNMEPVQMNVLCSSLRTHGGYMYLYNGKNTSNIDINDENEKIHIASYSRNKTFETAKPLVKSMNFTSIVLSKCRSLSIHIDMVSPLMYNVEDDEKSQELHRTPSPPPEQHDDPDNGLTWKIPVYVACGIGVCVVATLCIYWKKRRNKAGYFAQPQVAINMDEIGNGQGGQQQESEENENNQETERALLHLFRVTTDVQNPGEQENRHTNGGPRLPNGARCSHGDTEETDVLVDKQVQGNQSNDNQSSENSCGREEQPNGVEFAGQKYDQ